MIIRDFFICLLVFLNLLFYSFFFFLNEGSRKGVGGGGLGFRFGLHPKISVFVNRNFLLVSPISFLAKCSDNLIKYM